MNTRHEDDYNFLFKCKSPNSFFPPYRSLHQYFSITYLDQLLSLLNLTYVCVLFVAVILVGDTGVGKTHLLSRYIKNSLPKNKYPTIGVEFATKAVPLRAGGTVKA